MIGRAAAPFLIAAIAVPACRASVPVDAGDEGGETTSGETSAGAGATSLTDPDACDRSDDCETDGRCVAPYDPYPLPGMDGRGSARCVPTCVELDDPLTWCIDDSACCTGLRCQEVDGLCRVAPGETGTGETGTTGETGSTTEGGAGSDDTGETTGSETGTTTSSSSVGESTAGTG